VYSCGAALSCLATAKGEIVLVHGVGKSGVTALLDGGRWSASSAGSFTPGKGSRHPFNVRADGVESGSGRFGAGRRLFRPKELQSPTIQAVGWEQTVMEGVL